MTRQNLGRGILLLCLLVTLRVSASPFSNIFVFGDSLSDTGNFALLFNGFSQPPYDRGFSNGPRAVEVLAENLGLKADASLYIRPGPLVGTNFAVAVARAGGEGPFDLTAQISAFLSSQGGTAPSDALYFVFIAAPWFAPLARVRARLIGLEGGLTYRPGTGRQHSLSDTAIRKRAKANGWTRDLLGAVRSRVRERLVRGGGFARTCSPG